MTRNEQLRRGDRYLLSGEFHYFRVPRRHWRPRLRQARDLGLNAVSIYVPWNWHAPTPDGHDFTGAEVAERDLHGALAEIADAGLGCVLRPGPFITAEWRHGGIPRWLWEEHPEVRAVNSAGAPTPPATSYPVLTYGHPVYVERATRWVEAVLDVAAPHLGPDGCVINIQLDDEPSYWWQLYDPLAIDYNPVLVDPDGDAPSAYGAWLLARHGSLDAVNAAHGSSAARPRDLGPPRAYAAGPADMARMADWHAFKLDQINEHMGHLHGVVAPRAPGVQISMLQPYLLAVQPGHFAGYVRREGLDMQLTNEVYLTLFEAMNCPETKVGHVVAAYEDYHMWRAGTPGRPVTMELQGSNASYIPPGAMELLYGITVARGIQGVNFYMLVGGENPPGFENQTGSAYDTSCPISATGEERPHAAAIAKMSAIVRAAEPAVLAAEPLRDVWCGWYPPYSTTVLTAGMAAPDLAELMDRTFSAGFYGTATTPSLQALMALSGVSHGAVDITGDADLSACRQLWVLGHQRMAADVQRRLLDYVRGGGHLVVLPRLPELDEDGTPGAPLAEALFGTRSGGAAPVEYPSFAATGGSFAIVATAGGQRLAAPGPAAVLPRADGAEVVAVDADTDAPCALRRSVGDGTLTLLGFRLEYAPTEARDHGDFLIGMVEEAVGARATVTADPVCTAMQLSGPLGGLLCVVNPTDLPRRTAVTYTAANGERRELPEIGLPGKGARLLPVDLALPGGVTLVSATAELVGVETEPARDGGGDGELVLRFAADGDVVLRSGEETRQYATTSGVLRHA
jgi:beta-galactosidase